MDKPKNKKYTQTKLMLSLSGGLMSFGLLLVFILGGYNITFARLVENAVSDSYLQFLIFTAALSVAGIIVSLPLDFYGGYIIEHRYGLSNQTKPAWLKEELKGTLVGMLIGLPLLMVFYFCLTVFESYWWIPVGIVYYLFSVLLARLAPTLLFPLFYKFTPLESESLKNRLIKLSDEVSLHISGLYQFNLSKNTKKANAAFAGIGKSKRIILADTLLEQFTEEEIEVIFAHETGHYYHRHISKLLLTGAVAIFAGLGTAAWLYQWIVARFYGTALHDLSVLPVLGLIMAAASMLMMPAQNIISRHFERQADRYALSKTRNAEAFIESMRKLARMNMSDDSPHPLVEFLFYSHPAIRRRIEAAQTFAAQDYR